MDMNRKRQIKIDPVLKVMNFLSEVKDRIMNGKKFFISDLAEDFHVDRILPTVAFKSKYLARGVVKGEYQLGENFGDTEQHAKRLIELTRRYKIKSSENSAELSSTIESNAKDDQYTGARIKRDTEAKMTSILKKALHNAQAPSNTLFSEQEKEFEHKVKIASSVAIAIYGHNTHVFSDMPEELSSLSIDERNNRILEITNDLYEKLKNNR